MNTYIVIATEDRRSGGGENQQVILGFFKTHDLAKKRITEHKDSHSVFIKYHVHKIGINFSYDCYIFPVELSKDN